MGRARKTQLQAASKGLTTPVHLALSPTPSERSRKEELESINALIKKAGDGDLTVLRERRESDENKHKAGVREKVENPYAAVRNDELKAINDLINNPEKVRHRRLSGESQSLKNRGQQPSSDDAHHPYPVDASTPATAEPEPVPQADSAAAAAAPGKETSPAKQRWQDAMIGMKVHAALGTSPHDDAEDRLPSPDDVKVPADMLNASTKNLSGAAARGAKAAALGRVKQAASSVGGVFLTTEQWEAIRTEVAGLKVTNKRLEEELAEARAQLTAKDDELVKSEERASTASLLAGAGTFIAKAWAAASPMAMRSSSRSASANSSPFGARFINSHRSPVVVDVGSKAGIRPPVDSNPSLW